jgi:hypothetical protein
MAAPSPWPARAAKSAAAEQQQAAEDQRVGGDRPADRGAAEVQVAGQARQGDVHGSDVEDDHQLGDQEHRQKPLRRLGLVGSGSVPGGAAAVHRALLLACGLHDEKIAPVGCRPRRGNAAGIAAGLSS